MNPAIESGNPDLLEKFHHQQDVQRFRQRSIKVARAAKHLKGEGSQDNKGAKHEENPTTTEARALQKTSLTRSLPAVSMVVQAPLLRQLREDCDNRNGTFPTEDTLDLDPPDLSVKILRTFERVSRKLHSGEDLGPLKDQLVDMLSGLNEKIAISEGILSLYQSHRMASLVKAQAKVTDYLILCSQRNDLTPAEALAFFKLFGDEIASIVKS